MQDPNKLVELNHQLKEFENVIEEYEQQSTTKLQYLNKLNQVVNEHYKQEQEQNNRA